MIVARPGSVKSTKNADDYRRLVNPRGAYPTSGPDEAPFWQSLQVHRQNNVGLKLQVLNPKKAICEML